jgi:hypothetical protein
MAGCYCYPGLDAAAEDDKLKAEQGWDTLQLAEAQH